MLHLYPVKVVLGVCFIAAAVLVAGLFDVGLLGSGNPIGEASTLIKYSWTVAGALPVVFYFFWRASKGAQKAIFPYLGGEWAGQLRFSAEGGGGVREVTMQVHHTLISLKLFLDSEESESQTLVVQAAREPASMLRHLYYIYRNVRKESAAGAGETYRGLAILEVASTDCTTLSGTYFTERGSRGTLSLKLKRLNPIWTFWK